MQFLFCFVLVFKLADSLSVPNKLAILTETPFGDISYLNQAAASLALERLLSV